MPPSTPTPSTLPPLLLAAALLAGSSPVQSAEVLTGSNPDTGLRSWTWQHQGISLQLVQRLPDQTRAFFLGRGFSSEDADRIARACVFQTIFRNDGQQPIDYNLDDWFLIAAQASADRKRPLQTRERWDAIWQQQDTAQAARIAFRWSLLPTVQHFEPGDYNWGMSSYGLPPGSPFDLTLALSIAGKTITGHIPAVVCAPETGNPENRDTP